MHDEIEITIMDDGRIKVVTDQFSGPNHLQAENLVKFLEKEMGGEVVKAKRADTHKHHEQKHKIGHRQ